MQKRIKEDRYPLYESGTFDMSFRGTSQDLISVKIYTTKNSFQTEKQVSFDSEYSQITSLEYFAGSVLSSIILTLLEQSKKSGSIIEEIEGVLTLSLENPLTFVGVKGYNEEPCIRKITVTIFILIDPDFSEFNRFCNMALKNSPIYNTIKKSMDIELIVKRIG
jgi:uncharacterized OsmC-like protein